MKTSELIEELLNRMERYGDVEVLFGTTGDVDQHNGVGRELILRHANHVNAYAGRVLNNFKQDATAFPWFDAAYNKANHKLAPDVHAILIQ